jgi:hypothetical protein
MRSRMNALWRRRVGFALSLIVAVSFMAFSCASSSPGSYKLGFQGTSPRFNTSTWTIEHNLFNGKSQRADKEAWEEDWPG